jgi:glycosyltransferase 2 family protein
LDWRAVVGVGISLFLLGWIMRGVNPAEVWAGIRGVHVGWFALSIVVGTAGLAIRAMRWRVLLEPVLPNSRFGPRFASLCIGFMANNLLPARAGEFARVFALSRLEPVPLSGALGSLVVERFLDAVAILALLAVALAAPSFPSDATIAGRPLGAAVGGASALLIAVLIPVLLLLLFPSPALRIAHALAERIRFVRERALVQALETFLVGLAALRTPRHLVPASLWSLFFWIWHSSSLWFAFRAFGIEVDFVGALFMNGILAFFVAVPSSPGFFGTFHAGALLALSVYAVPEDRVLSFAFGHHLAGFIPVTLLGLWYSTRLGLSLREMGGAEGAAVRAAGEGT